MQRCVAVKCLGLVLFAVQTATGTGPQDFQNFESGDYDVSASEFSSQRVRREVPFFESFEASSSKKHFKTVPYEDDFFAEASHTFDDFYDYDDHHGKSNPYAASHHDHRSTPYSASSHSPKKAHFEDFGHPDGFFDDIMKEHFGEGSHSDGSGKGSGKAGQETRSQPSYDHFGSGKKEKSTQKCETVHKNGMTCEICKDDYGGFSEHCSHSLNSGKDQKYANSRRSPQDERYHPSHHSDHDHSFHKEPRKKSASNDRAYNRNDKEDYAPNESSSSSQPKNHNQKPSYKNHNPKPSYKNHKQNRSFYSKHNPKEGATYHKNDSPHQSYDSLSDKSESASEHLPSSQVKDQPIQYSSRSEKKQSSPQSQEQTYSPQNERQKYDPQSEKQKHFPQTKKQKDSAKVSSESVQSPDIEVAVFAKKQSPSEEDHGASYSKAHSHPDPVFHSNTYKIIEDMEKDIFDYPFSDHAVPQSSQRQEQRASKRREPLLAEENLKFLGKKVKQFGKKDRTNCKKRTTKKGLTCYVCPNKNGQVGEECMFENADTKNGVQMMYKEQVTY